MYVCMYVCMYVLLRTDEGSETKMTSNNDSVVAVILVGSVINCCRFISRVKLLMAAYSRQELSRPSQFRSPRIIIGLFNNRAWV